MATGGFGRTQLKALALQALEEAAAAARDAPGERGAALRLALALLWSLERGSRAPYIWFWRSLKEPNRLARSQNLNASLNAIRRACGGG